MVTWSNCAECHTNPASYAQFTCIDCHEHNQADMNDKHGDVQGYTYNSPACFACHPPAPAKDHSTIAHPLSL